MKQQPRKFSKRQASADLPLPKGRTEKEGDKTMSENGKIAYPVILTKEKEGNWYSVEVPGFNVSTQGDGIADAIYMARDVISLMAIDYEDDGKELPEAKEIVDAPEGAIVTWVDADLVDYRRKFDKKTVKKNCTIPSYLNYAAEKQGINFSKVLQEALIEKLGVTGT